MRAIDEGITFSVVVTGDEMQERKLPSKPLRFRFSKANGQLVEVDPTQPPERIRGELSKLVFDARELGAHNIRSAGHLKVTRLMAVYLDTCRRHPDAIVLIRLKDTYEALMHHAATVSAALNLPLSRRTNTYMCAIKASLIEHACRRLKELGHEIVVAEYESRPEHSSTAAA
jgi:hypothetical protein